MHLFDCRRLSLRPIGRRVPVLVLLELIVTLVIRLRHEPTVSASQFLANAIQAQALQTRTTHDPVVHQRLQVRRKDQARDASANFEIWNDTKNSRVRQFLTDGNQSIPITASASTIKGQTRIPGGDLVSELEQVLKANHMDPARPLSAASYQSWHNTLQHQRDEITKSKLADGNDAVTLRTIPPAPVNVGQIAEATFVVRATDWLPTQLRLDVAAEGGHHVYELSQKIGR